MSKTQFSGFTEPKFIIDRREKLRLEALAEGKRALEAIRENGGNAVIFGSVLRPGEFTEDSDIDLCFLTPEKYQNEDSFRFFRLAESAVHNFPIDISWFEDLKDTVKEKVIKEIQSASNIR